MAINFTIGNLTNDQTSGVQSPADGDDINVTLDGSNLDGLDTDFETFLAALGLSNAQKAFAVDVDAGSKSGLIQISATAGERINDLKLIADSSSATGWTTLAGLPLYLHVDSSGNYATLTTSTGSGGTIFAAFALTGETIDNVARTASAGVQIVTFAPIKHENASNPDDTVALGDVLRVAADTAISFNFTQLAAGNFLWAAVGNGNAAMLITGRDLNVIDTPGKLGEKVNSGSADPTDTVNTSKATDTTIGINAQHFAPTNSGDGPIAVFTFVTGYAPLKLPAPQYTGQNIQQIDYDNYINVSSASIFVSQLTGSANAKIKFSLFEAGGGGSADHLTSALVPEEGYHADPNNKFSYIGDQDSDSNLIDDTEVIVASVTITRGGGAPITVTGSGPIAALGVTVTFNGHSVIVDGARANDLINLRAANDPGNPLDGTFNRINVQALAGSGSFDIGHIDLTSGGTSSAGLGSHLFLDDDGPVITAQAAGSATPNNLQVDNSVGPLGVDSSSYTLAAGTDGQKSFEIIGPADSSGALRWSYFDVDGSGTAGAHEIKGTYNVTVGTTTTTSDLYTLVLNANGSYTFTMIGTLPSSYDELSTAEIKAGAPDTNSILVGVTDNDNYVTISGASTVGGNNINESHGFVGVDNGNLDKGESLTFRLYDGDGLPDDPATDTLLSFEGISIGTKSASGGNYSWTATLADGSGSINSNGSVFVPKNQPLVINPGGGVLLSSVTVTKESGQATKIGIGDIKIFLPADDVRLSFGVKLIDGDNDSVTTSFFVDIDGNHDGNFDATASSAAATTSALAFDRLSSSMDLGALYQPAYSVQPDYYFA